MLIRSAIAMGLNADDYVIKQRLVQKMEFMAEGVTSAMATPSDVELADFHQRHQADYGCQRKSRSRTCFSAPVDTAKFRRLRLRRRPWLISIVSEYRSPERPPLANDSLIR